MENRKAKIQTYLLQLQSGAIRGNQMEVLEHIYKNSGCTIADLRRELFMPHQTASSALSVLMDCGLVKEIGTEKIEDTVYSKLQFVPDGEEQDSLSHERKMNKIKQWAKKGLEEYGDVLGFTLKQELQTI